MQDIASPIRCDDETMPPSTPLAQWSNHLVKASNKLGRSLEDTVRYKELMAAAGFEDIVEVQYKWPQNPWPRDPKYKELGMWTLHNIDYGLEGLSLALFCRGLEWQRDDLMAFLGKVRKDLRNMKIHSYWAM